MLIIVSEKSNLHFKIPMHFPMRYTFIDIDSRQNLMLDLS